MNNKKIIALAISAILILPVSAAAKDNSHNPNNGQVNKQETVQSSSQKTSKPEAKADKNEKDSVKAEQKKDNTSNVGQEKKQENEQKKDEKKQQIETFKTEMKEKKQTMKQIKQQTIELKQQIEPKVTELTNILNEIKDGKRTLSEENLNILLAKADNLKADNVTLKSYSEINKDVAETQDKVNKSDFNNALSSLDKVISKLQARLDALKKLNSDLDEALTIARQAVASSDGTSSVSQPTVTPSPTVQIEVTPALANTITQ